MPWVPLIPVEAVPAEGVTEARLGDRTYAVCGHAGGIYVIDGDCPHRDGPLGHGGFHFPMVVCPWHAWEFDVRTGECDIRPDCRVGTYAHRVEDGQVCIEVAGARTS